MREILIVGSPLAGLAGLPLALWQGCDAWALAESRWRGLACRGVVREWFGGGDGGELGRGLPPCRFGWSAARAEARLSFALWQCWLLLELC